MLKGLLRNLKICGLIASLSGCAYLQPKTPRPEIEFWRADLSGKYLVNSQGIRIPFMSDRMLNFACFTEDDFKILMEYVIRLEDKREF